MHELPINGSHDCLPADIDPHEDEVGPTTCLYHRHVIATIRRLTPSIPQSDLDRLARDLGRSCWRCADRPPPGAHLGRDRP